MEQDATHQDDVLAGLAEVLADVARVDRSAVTPEARLADDLGIDSLTLVDVVVAAEDRFGLRHPGRRLGPLRDRGRRRRLPGARGASATLTRRHDRAGATSPPGLRLRYSTAMASTSISHSGRPRAAIATCVWAGSFGPKNSSRIGFSSSR